MLDKDEIYLTIKTIRQAPLFGDVSLSFINLISFDYFDICDGYIAGYYIHKMWNKKNSFKGIITHKCVKIDVFEEIHNAITNSTENKNEIPYIDGYHPVVDVLRNIEARTDYLKPYWFLWHFIVSMDYKRLKHGVQNPIDKSDIEFIDNLINVDYNRARGNLFGYYNDASFLKVLYEGKQDSKNTGHWIDTTKGISSFKKRFKLSKDWKQSLPSKRKEFIGRKAIRQLFDESILIETLKS